jgi:hypothetical protein
MPLLAMLILWTSLAINAAGFALGIDECMPDEETDPTTR